MTEEAIERIPYLIYFGKRRLQKHEVWKIHRRTEFERVMEPCLQGDPERLLLRLYENILFWAMVFTIKRERQGQRQRQRQRQM